MERAPGVQVLGAASPSCVGCASPAGAQQRRHLNVHEHQAMDILTRCGIKVPQYKVATSADEAQRIAQEFGTLGAFNLSCLIV